MSDAEYEAQISKSLSALGYGRDHDRKLTRPPPQFSNDIADMVPPPPLFSGQDSLPKSEVCSIGLILCFYLTIAICHTSHRYSSRQQGIPATRLHLQTRPTTAIYRLPTGSHPSCRINRSYHPALRWTLYRKPAIHSE